MLSLEPQHTQLKLRVPSPYSPEPASDGCGNPDSTPPRESITLCEARCTLLNDFSFHLHLKINGWYLRLLSYALRVKCSMMGATGRMCVPSYERAKKPVGT